MNQTEPRAPTLPDPDTAPELFEGLLGRRVFAFVIDLIVIGAMITAFGMVGLIAGFVTFGLAWVALTLVVPASLVLYYGATQAMDLVLTPTRGQPLDGWMAIIHAAVFWITTWISWPVSLLFALFTPRRQMIHDLITGTLMLRRSPMERHWREHSARTSQAF